MRKSAFQPSAATRRRVWELVRKEKEEGLTPDEKCELDEYEQLEHLLILAKAKAVPATRMAERISPALRREVASRAGFRCEYCLMPETELFASLSFLRRP